MKLYEVTYRPNIYSEPKTLQIVATDVVKAATEIQKRQYDGYSKTVTAVVETLGTVYVAK